jgi:receptor protein-tyrosine kinase
VTSVSKPRGHLIERAVQASQDLDRPAAADLPGAASASLAKRVAAAAAASQPPAATAPAARSGEPEPAAVRPVPLTRLAAAGLIIPAAARSRAAEEIAVLQHHIVRTVRATPAGEGRAVRSVLITSARPGEGKSFTTLNVGAGVAATGAQPVIVLDIDGKRGSLTALLGLDDRPGLRAMAADPTRHPGSLLVPTERERLFILPYGTRAEGEASVVGGAALVAAVQRIATALPRHILMIDAPPCLATSEASTLASLVGQILMVVEAEVTQRKELESALDMVEACPQVQLVLNQSRLVNSDSFGAYGAYGAYAAPRDDRPAG